MKRTLLVASLALLSASAFAQSTVSVYGRVNVTAEREKTNGVSSTNLNDNASRIGFRGTEDLGGGLKAGFVLEHGFDVSTGAAAARFWGRESNVYVQGGFGKVTLGNMAASTAYFATADYVSMHNHDTGTSSDSLYSFVSTGALQNAIGYTSPSLGGAVFEIQYGVKEGAQTESPIAASLTYSAGNLYLGAGYEKFGSDKSLAFAALYTMGAFNVGGYYERGGGTNEVNNFRLAGMYSMGASEFHVNFGKRGDTNNVANTGGKQATLGYNYNLSKRTKVYGYYTKLDFDGGFDYSSLALGVRHNF
jgi:predicted porin